MENNFFLQEDQLQKTSNSIDSAGEKKIQQKTPTLIQIFKTKAQNVQ